MPLELQIIRASEFIRVGAQGRLDLEASKAVLRELSAACRRRNIDRALLDVRDVVPGATPMLSPRDLAELVNVFREIGFRQEQRLAVLYLHDPHKRARLFAFLGAMRGWSVRAFGDYEKALAWLALTGGDDELPPRDEQPERIAVRRAGDHRAPKRKRAAPVKLRSANPR